MRIMGLDFGSKTVGVAISDALKLTAQGIEIIPRESAVSAPGNSRRCFTEGPAFQLFSGTNA